MSDTQAPVDIFRVADFAKGAFEAHIQKNGISTARRSDEAIQVVVQEVLAQYRPDSYPEREDEEEVLTSTLCILSHEMFPGGWGEDEEEDTEDE